LFTRTRYQQGSLTRKPREKGDTVWEFRFYDYDPLGSRRRQTRIVGTVKQYPTESAARKSAKVQGLLLRLNTEHVAAGLVVPTFGQVLARYEQEEMPERYSTRAAYLSMINNYIRPRWAEVPLSDVKALVVEAWLKQLDLAPKTKNHVKGVMRCVFNSCHRWELVDKNPMALVQVKGGTKRLHKPEVLTEQEFSSLLKNLGQPYQTMVLLAGCLGLRVSEIMGLQWGDVDFDKRTLLVQRGVVHGRVDDVKTEYSHEFVPLDEQVAKALAAYRLGCIETPQRWMFANPATGRPYHQEQIQKTHLQDAAKVAGIEWRLGWHTFRHSYRSWLEASGAGMTIQKELMRHASIQTTMNVYGRAMTDSKREANTQVVSKLFAGKGKEEAANAA
jgi:integrase